MKQTETATRAMATLTRKYEHVSIADLDGIQYATYGWPVPCGTFYSLASEEDWGKVDNMASEILQRAQYNIGIDLISTALVLALFAIPAAVLMAVLMPGSGLFIILGAVFGLPILCALRPKGAWGAMCSHDADAHERGVKKLVSEVRRTLSVDALMKYDESTDFDINKAPEAQELKKEIEELEQLIAQAN